MIAIQHQGQFKSPLIINNTSVLASEKTRKRIVCLREIYPYVLHIRPVPTAEPAYVTAKLAPISRFSPQGFLDHTHLF